MSNFCFRKIFRKQKRTVAYGLASLVSDFNSPGKMMTSYLRVTNKFLMYHALCTRILKCGFPKKDIKLTQFILFEVLECLSFEITRFKPFRYVWHENLWDTSDSME